MARLTAIVLGSAAGGGFPQWNCRCPVCRLAWDGDDSVIPRTQTGLAVSGDGENWILLNAAPELRPQIAATPELHANGAPRGSPIVAVVLTGAEIDQTAGLLNLREGHRFALCATADTLAALAANPMFDALAPDLVRRRAVGLSMAWALPGGVEAELFPVPGKVPLYLEAGRQELTAPEGGNVGVELQAAGARLVFIPGAAAINAELMARLSRADIVLFDGTLYDDDELLRLGAGTKTGLRMGHMPIGGPGGSLAALAPLASRRIYIHLNNTNPVLIAGSPQRRAVEAAGWEVAFDGLRITL